MRLHKNFYLIASLAALGGVLPSYDTGVISGALLFIRHVMPASPTLEGGGRRDCISRRCGRCGDGRTALGSLRPPPRDPVRRFAVHLRRCGAAFTQLGRYMFQIVEDVVCMWLTTPILVHFDCLLHGRRRRLDPAGLSQSWHSVPNTTSWLGSINLSARVITTSPGRVAYRRGGHRFRQRRTGRQTGPPREQTERPA
jgi:hypothetical protein